MGRRGTRPASGAPDRRALPRRPRTARRALPAGSPAPRLRDRHRGAGAGRREGRRRRARRSTARRRRATAPSTCPRAPSDAAGLAAGLGARRRRGGAARRRVRRRHGGRVSTRARAALPASSGAWPGLVYEAHSTDYQSGDALRALVGDHFAILKVGPWLTFAFREALFALEEIEREVLARSSAGDGGAGGGEPSRLRETLDAAMRADPRHWREVLRAATRPRWRTPAPSASATAAGTTGRSPRCRRRADRLLRNLAARPSRSTCSSQLLPAQYAAVSRRGARAVPGGTDPPQDRRRARAATGRLAARLIARQAATAWRARHGASPRRPRRTGATRRAAAASGSALPAGARR